MDTETAEGLQHFVMMARVWLLSDDVLTHHVGQVDEQVEVDMNEECDVRELTYADDEVEDELVELDEQHDYLNDEMVENEYVIVACSLVDDEVEVETVQITQPEVDVTDEETDDVRGQQTEKMQLDADDEVDEVTTLTTQAEQDDDELS